MTSDFLELDQTDLIILEHLRKDGRRSFTDLSHELNVSVGMIRNRYNRLVSHNILHIIGWTDPVRAGLQAYARVVLKVRPTLLIESVIAKLQTITEVSFLAVTTGNWDLEINLVCKSNDSLLRVMNEKILGIEGVSESSTTMYLKILKWASHDLTQAMNLPKNPSQAAEPE
jgi:Lrp/AsnC family transcriptional regulator for asnA, asnC and gidA